MLVGDDEWRHTLLVPRDHFARKHLMSTSRPEHAKSKGTLVCFDQMRSREVETCVTARQVLSWLKTVSRETTGTSFFDADVSSLEMSRPIRQCSANIDTAPIVHRLTAIPLILLFLPFLIWYIHILVQDLSPGQKCTPSSHRCHR